MNDEVREALAELCSDKAPNDFVFKVPKPNHVCGKRNEVFAQPADWLVLKY